MSKWNKHREKREKAVKAGQISIESFVKYLLSIKGEILGFALVWMCSVLLWMYLPDFENNTRSGSLKIAVVLGFPLFFGWEYRQYKNLRKNAKMAAVSAEEKISKQSAQHD